MDRKLDFIDFQRDFGSEFTENFTGDDLEKQMKKLRILRFGLDKKRVNIVSSIEGTIVFVDRDYAGTVQTDDVWLCSVTESGNVYYAVPLKKFTSATFAEFDERLRAEVEEHIWEANRPALQKAFAEKYRKEIYEKAVEEANSKNSEIIRSLRDRVAELEKQAEQSRIVIESGSRPEDEGIELSSEEMPEPAAVPVQEVPEQEEIPPRILTGGGYLPRVPGIPEIRAADGTQTSGSAGRKYYVERLDERTLYSDAFADGKYFVHVNRSGKFLVIRPNGYANVIATNRRMVIEGLNVMARFTGRKSLVAEYSSRYDGLLVYL